MPWTTTSLSILREFLLLLNITVTSAAVCKLTYSTRSIHTLLIEKVPQRVEFVDGNQGSCKLRIGSSSTSETLGAPKGRNYICIGPPTCRSNTRTAIPISNRTWCPPDCPTQLVRKCPHLGASAVEISLFIWNVMNNDLALYPTNIPITSGYI